MSNYWDRPPRQARAAKTVRQPKPLQTHVFTPSGVFVRTAKPDEPSQEVCGRHDCGSPRWFRVHDLPDTVDAAVIDQRRIGEGTQQ